MSWRTVTAGASVAKSARSDIEREIASPFLRDAQELARNDILTQYILIQVFPLRIHALDQLNLLFS